MSTQSLIETKIYHCWLFFVAMFVTPPDAISMIMLAVPMWLLLNLDYFLEESKKEKQHNFHSIEKQVLRPVFYQLFIN